MWLQGHPPRLPGISSPQPADSHSFPIPVSGVTLCTSWQRLWADSSRQGALGAVAQRQSEMAPSWEDEIPPPCMTSQVQQELATLFWRHLSLSAF